MTARNPFPSAEETMNHPAYEGTIWNLEPEKKGILACAKDRGGPVDISWELHGTGPRKILFLMGLGGLATSWQRQTKYFAHDRGDTYSVLLVDNRGVGLSGTPIQRYTTSQMARDVLEVLEHVGWVPAGTSSSGRPSCPPPSSSSSPPSSTAPPSRSFHLVGISLGGMISQELAVLIPHHLASLTLLCTAASMELTRNIFGTIAERLPMLLPKPTEQAIYDTSLQIFTEEWLRAPDEAKELPVPGETLKCLPPGGGSSGGDILTPSDDNNGNNNSGSGSVPLPRYASFDSNYQRFQAQELAKRLDKNLFSVKGFVLQLAASAGHDKSPAKLRELGDRVGRERIAVVHGTRDVMIDVRFGRVLIERLRPGVALVVEGMGHAPVMENVDWTHEFLTERFDAGEKLKDSA